MVILKWSDKLACWCHLFSNYVFLSADKHVSASIQGDVDVAKAMEGTAFDLGTSLIVTEVVVYTFFFSGRITFPLPILVNRNTFSINHNMGYIAKELLTVQVFKLITSGEHFNCIVCET